MSSLHYKYVLVGGGLASSAAAESIRSVDRVSPILLLGQEINRPYDRTPLSKNYLRHKVRHEELFTLPADWFAKNDVHLRTGRRAARLDPARHVVTLDNGEDIAFDSLLIATGGSPLSLDIPGANLPNVFSLRTLDDVGRLQNAFEKAKQLGQPHPRGRGRISVVGAGWLGTELACTLSQLGYAVDLIEMGEWPLNRVIGEASGRFVERFLAAKEITLHLNTQPARFDGDGRAQRVVLSDGTTLPADFVIVCVGMKANKELLRGTTIAAEKAILVDGTCATSVPYIYSAGDCCAILDALYNKHRWLGHAEHARVTGRIAGLNMAGQSVRYDAVDLSTSQLFDVPLKTWGEARFVHHRILRGTPNVECPNFAEIGIAADGRVSQVVLFGESAEQESLIELVRTRRQIDGDEEQYKDPASAM